MTKAGDNIRKSILKRQKAIDSFIAQKEAFTATRNQIIKDIEEARTIWINTVDQLPEKEFKQ
jgi:enoyl reductase-like protein